MGWCGVVSANGLLDEFRITSASRTDFAAAFQMVGEATDALPDNPKGVTAKAVGTDSIELRWASNPTAADFDHIAVYRSAEEGTKGSLIHTTDDTEESNRTWTDTGLEDGETYYYYLLGVDAQGNEADLLEQGFLSDGLKGSYYSGTNHDSLVGSRIDPVVNFSWPTGDTGIAGMPTTNFSTRWEGYIRIDANETITFRAATD